MTRPLWDVAPNARRIPLRIKKHSRFLGGTTVTLVGTRWSRTWGLLPAGTKMSAIGTPEWPGGINWCTRINRAEVLARPTLALCKWRYR